MTSYPSSTSSAAATELSTPPDMATRTRGLTVRPQPIADCGLRIADSQWEVERRLDTSTDNPQSAIRNPQSWSPVQHCRQRPHLLDDLREARDQRLHVLRRAGPAEREPQRCDAQVPRDSHRR